MNTYFFPGLGEKPSEYPELSQHMTIIDIDWNTGTYKPVITKADTVVAFSMGIFLAEYIDSNHLILCSPTPGIESLEKIKTKKVTFIIGDKEKWVQQEAERVAKTLPCPYVFIIIPEEDHKITENYRKILLETLKSQ